MMSNALIREFTEIYDRYLSDESSETGFATDIAFPETAEDVAALIRQFQSEDSDYTIQGGLSGIRGEAVPHGGHIINTSRMTQFDGVYQTGEGDWIARVQPGITLEDLKMNIAKAARGRGLIWPPAPSEGSACIGGIVASGAFGMNICSCGDTADHIYALEYVSKNGETVRLADNSSLKNWLNDNNTEKKGSCITALSLKLVKEPEVIWGTAFFFDNEDDALEFADRLSAIKDKQISSMEYIDAASIHSTEGSRETLPALAADPSVPDGTKAVIYVEVEGSDGSEEDAVEELMMEVAETAAECGADLDTAWAFTGAAEIARFHDFRHAVTESATQNMAKFHAADRELHLISFDLWGKGTTFSDLMNVFGKAAADKDILPMVCGSIGTPVIRAIIVPEDMKQQNRGKELRANFIEEGGF